MDDEDLFDVAGEFAHVVLEFVLIGVAGEGIHCGDTGADIVGFAEDVHRVFARADLGAQGMLGAVADEEHESAGFADVILQVMPHTASLTHAGGADDDGRFLEFIQLHGLGHLTDVSEVLHAEGVGLFPEEIIGLLVEAFRVETVDLRGVHAERAVHKDGDARQLAFFRELVQGEDDVLGTAYGEGGDDDLALLLDGVFDEFQDFVIAARFGHVTAIAVGAFDLEEVHVFHRFGITQDIVIPSANIAGEEVAELLAVLTDIKDHLGGAQNVTGILEGERDPIGDKHGAVVTEGHELVRGHLRILDGVEGFDGFQTFLDAVLGDELRVCLLDLGGVGKHHTGQIAGGKGAVDVPPETLFAEVGEVTAVIDVRVAQDGAIDLRGIKLKAAVAAGHLFAMTLEEAAFQQDSLTVHLQ